MNIQVMDNPIDMSGAAVWNRLHSERESICEAVIQDSVSDTHASRNQDSANSATWHLSLLQARLKKVDDALDRLMSGSYGNCCACGNGSKTRNLSSIRQLHFVWSAGGVNNVAAVTFPRSPVES